MTLALLLCPLAFDRDAREIGYLVDDILLLWRRTSRFAGVYREGSQYLGHPRRVPASTNTLGGRVVKPDLDNWPTVDPGRCRRQLPVLRGMRPFRKIPHAGPIKPPSIASV